MSAPKPYTITVEHYKSFMGVLKLAANNLEVAMKRPEIHRQSLHEHVQLKSIIAQLEEQRLAMHEAPKKSVVDNDALWAQKEAQQ